MEGLRLKLKQLRRETANIDSSALLLFLPAAFFGALCLLTLVASNLMVLLLASIFLFAALASGFLAWRFFAFEAPALSFVLPSTRRGYIACPASLETGINERYVSGQEDTITLRLGVTPQRHKRFSALIFCLALCWIIFPETVRAEPLRAPHLELELITDTTVVRPARPFQLGLRLTPEAGWHVYWINPGDSGLPLKITWEKPDDVEIDSFRFPYPEKIPFGPLVNYGYKSPVLLIAEGRVPASSNQDRLALSAIVDWVVCKEECIPGQGELSLALPIESGETPAPSKWSPLFEESRAKVPAPADWLHAVSKIEGQHVVVEISSSGPSIPADALTLFPVNKRVIDNAAPQSVERSSDLRSVKIRVQKSRVRNMPSEFSFVLVSEGGWHGTPSLPAVYLKSTIEGVLPEASKEPMRAADLQSSQLNVLLLLGAFAGGLILNLMPCVLPVLSLKIFGLLSHRDSTRKLRLISAALYCAGVLSGFWILAAILFVFKNLGVKAGWGFQLQQPAFVIGMSFLLLAMALNLCGTYDFGRSLQTMAGRFAAGRESLASFSNGLFATVLASPCTAPFMGTAIAAALVQSPLNGFVIFTALGLGMALPFMLVVLIPAAYRLFPKPGAWMETLRRALALPLFVTVLWLLWVFAQQTTRASLTPFLAGLTIEALALCVYGRLQQKTAGKSILALPAVAIACGLTLAIFSVQENLPVMGNQSLEAHGTVWERYSPEILARYRLEKRPVFIDFTAAWCLTCQVNKQLVFRTEKFAESIKNLGVVLLRADWTNRSASIADEIAKFGRSGVPLDVYYPSNPQTPPHVFSPLLTLGTVLDVIGAELHHEGKRFPTLASGSPGSPTQDRRAGDQGKDSNNGNN